MSLATRLASPTMWLVMAAWASMVIFEATGLSAAAGHHSLLEGFGLSGLSLLIFSLFWVYMVAAMMLPLNLRLVDTFFWTKGGTSPRWLNASAFLTGYALVWMAFGVVAFIGDAKIHALSHSSHFLHENGWIILATAIAVAGAHQLSPAKRRSLQNCHNATTLIIDAPAARWFDALAQGLRYGKSELACCWGLMLLAMAVGHGVLMMALFTGMMLVEKVFPKGFMTARVTGAALILIAGSLVILNA